jgi:hypothetical protein
MKKVSQPAGLLFALILSARATPGLAEAPLSLSKTAISPGGIWQVWATAVADGVRIGGVVVNGGRCRPSLAQSAEVAAHAALGQSERRLLGQYLCDPIDVEVATDLGDLTLRLDDESVQGPLAALKSDAIEPGHIWELRFAMHAEVGRIDSVVVNEGACAPHAPPSLPRELTYGETLGDFVYFCEPAEASVATDRGAFTFRWSKAGGSAMSAPRSAFEESRDDLSLAAAPTPTPSRPIPDPSRQP